MIVHHLRAIPRSDSLWCGVEVEAWQCHPGQGRRVGHVYVRAHATRNTILREQRSMGRKLLPHESTEVVTGALIEEFTRWVLARKSRDPEALKTPWTPRELRLLSKLDDHRPWRPPVALIEELGARMDAKRSRVLYALGDRLCVLGRPERSEL